MPFIPFSSATSYKNSTINSTRRDEDNVSTSTHNSDPNTNTSTSKNINLNNNGGSGNSSNNNSTSNSPIFPQSNFQVRRKPSVGNALFNLVNSIRQPPVPQPSRNRSTSQSSNPQLQSPLQGFSGPQSRSRSRSRSTSVSLRKKMSNNHIEPENPERFGDDVENSPVQRSSTPENTDQIYRPRLTGRGRRENRSDNQIQLTTILSSTGEREGVNDQNHTGLGFQPTGTVNPNEIFMAPPPTIQTPSRSTHTNSTSNNNIGNTTTTTTNNTISITNVDNSAHNTFNPSVYNHNMATSQTIPNFRIYTNGGLIGSSNLDNQIINDSTNSSASNIALRTRGNTLREDGTNVEAVAMNSENNPTAGTAITNPITIDDSRDDLMSVDGVEIDNNALIHNIVHSDQNNNTDYREINTGTSTNTPIVDGINATTNTACDVNGFYSIRLTPSIDHSSTHPYMFFGPIVRKLKTGKSISVGRYTEKSKKAAVAPAGSSEPIVFKSKVVSRKHAELTVDESGNWYIQDIKSSSGTFLNHVRLSLPNTESPKMPIKDSDILQLGVDYRGGSEEMYRCVKVKVELNYSWKKKAAKFSKDAHEKLKQLTNTEKVQELSPCAICLDDIKPGQPVFVSSCSHSWHYKCIRPLLVKTYPQFLCPNCKAVCDLEADLDDGDDDDDEDGEDPMTTRAHQHVYTSDNHNNNGNNDSVGNEVDEGLVNEVFGDFRNEELLDDSRDINMEQRLASEIEMEDNNGVIYDDAVDGAIR